LPIADEYWDLVAASIKGQTLGISWRGQEALAHFGVQIVEPFDFVYSGDYLMPLERGATIVPEALVKMTFRQTLQELADLLQRLSDKSPREIVVIGSPPPKRQDMFEKGVRREQYFLDRLPHLSLSLDEMKVTSEWVRLKLWRLHQDVMRRTAVENGATYMPIPPSTQDADGFLLPELAFIDATHANEHYGVLIMAELIKLSRKIEAGR